MEKEYKVGEFVKNLGVSAGFLKHHERYGTLTPHISSSGYRYYEFNQAMQAMQCLRLQKFGFTSKEISLLLKNSSEIDFSALILGKRKEFQKKYEFYQELLKYFDAHIDPVEKGYSSELPAESWSVYTPEPFYYLENSSERQFIEDAELQEIASRWTDYAPMTDIVSKVKVKPSENPAAAVQICAWNMGLTIFKSVAEHLSVPCLDKVSLIRPGKCLVYHYAGNREIRKGYEHLKAMLERPMEICRKHHFDIGEDVYEFNTFCSTSGSTSFVREVILIPVKD